MVGTPNTTLPKLNNNYKALRTEHKFKISDSHSNFIALGNCIRSKAELAWCYSATGSTGLRLYMRSCWNWTEIIMIKGKDSMSIGWGRLANLILCRRRSRRKSLNWQEMWSARYVCMSFRKRSLSRGCIAIMNSTESALMSGLIGSLPARHASLLIDYLYLNWSS